jgi:hypothetical protein
VCVCVTIRAVVAPKVMMYLTGGGVRLQSIDIISWFGHGGVGFCTSGKQVDPRGGGIALLYILA